MNVFDEIEKEFSGKATGRNVFDEIEEEAKAKPKRKTAKMMAEDMTTQLVGLDRQPVSPGPLQANIAAAGKALYDLPGQVGELGEALVSGRTFGASERAVEAAEYLSRKLFGEGKPHGVTGTWKEPKLPSYIKTGAEVIGSMATIGDMSKVIATPIIQTVSKSKYLAPFAQMIGWGTTGASYEGLSTLIQEGELPTPKELAIHGATWSVFAGAIASLGWTGRLTIGIKRLHKLWNIPRKEVIKVVMAEAKAKNMPIAKYFSVKGKVQKALSLKEAESANDLLSRIDALAEPFKRRGTYADLTKQLKNEEIENQLKRLSREKAVRQIKQLSYDEIEDQIKKLEYKKAANHAKQLGYGEVKGRIEVFKTIEGRIRAFKQHVGETALIGKRLEPKKIIAKRPNEIERILLKPGHTRTAEEIALLNRTKADLIIKTKHPAKVIAKPTRITLKAVQESKKIRELPKWIRKISEDVRYGKPVPAKALKRYHRWFAKNTQHPFHEPKPAKGIKIYKQKTAWRAETGYKHPKHATAADVVNYEQKELMNKLGVSAVKIKELEKYPAGNIKWVTASKKDAMKYGEPTKIPIGKNTEIIATDGEGGYLLLDKIKPLKAPRTEFGLKDIPKAPPGGKLQAAIKYPNGEIITGSTHIHCLEAAEKKGLDIQLFKGSARRLQDGFVDNRGNFLSREEATRAYGAGESVALKQMGVIEGRIDTRPVARLLRKKIIALQRQKRSDDEILVKLRSEKFKEVDIITVLTEMEHVKPGIRLGFGPAGELQRIYEKIAGKIAGYKLRKPLKTKIADVAPKPINEDVKLLLKALDKAKLSREKQEIFYVKTRAQKLARAKIIAKHTYGQKGFQAELRALGGEMPKVEFDPIVNKVGQNAINSLFEQIKNYPTLQAWERYPAGKGLGKLFGEYGGTVPTEGELKLLREVFGKELVEKLRKVGAGKIRNLIMDIINVPKAMRASFDISAGFRQGLFLVGRPKQWIPAFGRQFKYLVSRKSYEAAQHEITQRPMYRLMMENKLALTDLGSLSVREEAFQSRIAEFVPGVKASSQAFTGFLNDLRVHVFEDLAKKGIRLGIKDPKYLRDVAKYINHATGRGHLLKAEELAVELNAAFFSPRLIMSRLQLLNPVFYKRLHPKVRREALRDLFTIASMALTVGGLAKLAGYDVGNDPRCADFLKIKHGNTRHDILGGLQQPIRAAAQFITGTYISSVTGQPVTLGEGYKPMTRVGIVTKFLKGKLSPAVAFAVKMLGPKIGAEGMVDVPTETATLFVPMVLADMADLYNEYGQEGIPMAIPAFMGVGSQTYGGVASYGLHGKDYPAINKELNRLKMSMGFPSGSAYGQLLSAREYHAYKSRAGKNITSGLNRILKMSYYKKASDGEKKHIINQNIDRLKEEVKRRMFIKKRQIAELASSLKKTKYLTHEEALEMAKKWLNKRR